MSFVEPFDRSTSTATDPGARIPSPESRVPNPESRIPSTGSQVPWYDPAVAFVRWDPLQDLLAAQQRIARLATAPSGWTPAVDVFETPDRYVVMMELPGLTQDDVQLQHHEGRLTVSGTRRERESTCEQFHRIERGHGDFSRTFQLPLPIDAERITADLRDGVLTVTCPKSSDPSVRRIQIS